MRALKITQITTRREGDTIDIYLRELRKEKYSPVSPEQEVLLAQQYKTQDNKEALEKLINANLRFVVSVAKQYQGNGLSLEDLISEGNIGLIKTAQRYDPTRGFKFISYSVWWIRQAILTAIYEKSKLIRVPQNKINSLKKMEREFNMLMQKNEKEPTDYEIFEAIKEHYKEDYQKMNDKTKKELTELKLKKHFSLDATFSENDENTFLEILPDNSIESADNALVHRESLKQDMEIFLNKSLTSIQAQVIKTYYGIGREEKTLEEIGYKIGLSRERIRQIKEKAEKKLKGSHKFRDLFIRYLG